MLTPCGLRLVKRGNERVHNARGAGVFLFLSLPPCSCYTPRSRSPFPSLATCGPHVPHASSISRSFPFLFLAPSTQPTVNPTSFFSAWWLAEDTTGLPFFLVVVFLWWCEGEISYFITKCFFWYGRVLYCSLEVWPPRSICLDILSWYPVSTKARHLS